MLIDTMKPYPSIPVYERELEIVDNVLSALKMDDVFLYFDDDGLVATDDMDNEWHGAKFYEFLIQEAFVFEDESHVVGISDTLFTDFAKLASHLGVPVRDNKG